ncbi:signal peptidase II [Enterococcus nangangensis]|uniref:signal peptidase II n=1 Tax=Enterococcus nangangensis TaxID=2559926 RepID=UPI0010F44D08|nr:signal peptidase II [Enterococcus nangangensis]
MLAIYFILSGLLVALDQWTKFLTVDHIAIGEETSVIPGVISFTHLQNTGAAWSLLEGKMLFFAAITVVAVVIIVYCLLRYGKKSVWFSLGLALILAGAIGNFIDRMRLGYVVDMIKADFINFPIFNVADMCLVVGVIVVFIFVLKTDDSFFSGGKIAWKKK